MKFNALVVAAMAIISVNAAGEGGLLSCLGRICGSRSRVTQSTQVDERDLEMTWNLVGHKPKAEAPQDPSMSGPMPGSSQGPPMSGLGLGLSPKSPENGLAPIAPQDSQVNEQESAMPQHTAGNEEEQAVPESLSDNELGLRSSQESSDYDSNPGMLQSSSDDGSKPEYSSDSSGNGQGSGVTQKSEQNEPRPEVPQDATGNRQQPKMAQSILDSDSRPGVSEDLSMNRADTHQDSDTTKKADPECARIVKELYIVWDKIRNLNRELKEWNPVFYRIIMRGDSKAERVREWLKWNPKAIPDLRNFKVKYDDFLKDREDMWKRYDGNKCPKTFPRLSVEEMTQKGDIPNWKDENGVNFLSKQ
ncbi:hypothetical protein BASA50_006313 [Batrachochytrium salamandrivorans]|uniref:Uncharacterized protein n=1 Tax=Batrachochytrium salamandrivorans TaxID=1357716 RepID=A0ABQ8FAF1_9FUNG|nr:hypothetical protein BASA50_006313 [Batrachochytrium salamandrivorans]KAH9276789.1 hypothetical protein BASA83_000924 [Batrachochytrium salamandrivorans]